MSEQARADRAVEERPRWLAFLPATLFQPESPPRYVAIAWACSFFPSLLIAGLLAAVAPDAARPEFDAGPVTVLLLMVVFSPLLESLIMGGALIVLLRFFSPVIAVIASAAGWAIAHSLAAPIWGLVIWWPFLIFSVAFVTWRGRGLWFAIGLTALIHALQNLPPALILLAAR